MDIQKQEERRTSLRMINDSFLFGAFEFAVLYLVQIVILPHTKYLWVGFYLNL